MRVKTRKNIRGESYENRVCQKLLTHPIKNVFTGNHPNMDYLIFYLIIPKSLPLESLYFLEVFSTPLQASMAFRSASVALRKFLYFAT